MKNIKAEYSNPKYGLKCMVVDSSSYMTIQDFDNFALIVHRFGRDSICNKSYVTPFDTTIANEMANNYDLIYQPVSPVEWIVKLPNDVLDVELVATSNKDGILQRTFQWTRSNKEVSKSVFAH